MNRSQKKLAKRQARKRMLTKRKHVYRQESREILNGRRKHRTLPHPSHKKLTELMTMYRKNRLDKEVDKAAKEEIKA